MMLDPRRLLTEEANSDPYPLYHELRARDPVYRSEELGAWLLFAYADVEAMLRSDAFSARPAVERFLSAFSPVDRLVLAPLLELVPRWLLVMDPPNHGRLRSCMQGVLDAERQERAAAFAASTAEGLISAAVARGEMELMSELAHVLPLAVVGEVVGIPAERRAEVRACADDVSNFMACGVSAERALDSATRLRTTFRELIAARAGDPRDNVLGQLAAKRSELDEVDLCALIAVVFIAGLDTTAHMIGNGVNALLRHPEGLEQLRREPSLLPAAVDELCRYDGPIQHIARVALEDVEIAGRTIRRGHRVLGVIGAANRDPAQFADPDTIDFTRSPNRHFGFGFGEHICLGARLARLIGRASLAALLRAPAFELIEGEVELTSPGANVRGRRRLPIRFSRRR